MSYSSLFGFGNMDTSLPNTLSTNFVTSENIVTTRIFEYINWNTHFQETYIQKLFPVF